MRIAVITINSELHTCQRILKAGESLGHEVLLLDVLRFSIHTSEPFLRYRGEPLPHVSCGILRLGTQLQGLAIAIGKTLQSMSVPLLDNVVALETARDKFETLQILSKSGLPVPETELVRDLDQLAASLQRLGPLPVVIKPLHGSQGQGTILAEREMAAVSMMQSILFQSREFVLQKYIPCQGIDTRVMVVDGQVVAAMQREAPPGDFRSNLARGGTSRAVEVSEGMSELALRATHELGLNCAGVDIVEGPDGLVILEVNGSPGLSGIEQATGVDVASLWISALESRIEEQTENKKRWDHV